MRTIAEIKADMSTLENYMGHPDLRQEQHEYSVFRYEMLEAELRAALTEDISPSRLAEICQAEREGRCVVLPCKVGDSIYKIDSYNGDEIQVETVAGIEFYGRWFLSDDAYDGHICYFDELGKTIKHCPDYWSGYYLTREAAEASLKGAQP